MRDTCPCVFMIPFLNLHQLVKLLLLAGMLLKVEDCRTGWRTLLSACAPSTRNSSLEWYRSEAMPCSFGHGPLSDFTCEDPLTPGHTVSASAQHLQDL